MSKYTLSILVENHAGVLSKVTGLFSRRSFNIDSLAVGVADLPGTSRITIVVDGDEHTVDQVSKQLGKLIDVRTVKLLDSSNSVSRELLMVKVKATPERRAEIIQIVDIFRAKIVDVSPEALTIEITGEGDKIEAFTSMLDEFGVIELARTGTIALERGKTNIYR
jgi:acetolactate synthase-1/3 small subunit